MCAREAHAHVQSDEQHRDDDGDSRRSARDGARARRVSGPARRARGSRRKTTPRRRRTSTAWHSSGAARRKPVSRACSVTAMSAASSPRSWRACKRRASCRRPGTTSSCWAVARSSSTTSATAPFPSSRRKNAGILQRPVNLELKPQTKLSWRWIVEELPSLLPEDQLTSHDYLSIAAEYDDGQDLTYFWSRNLPVGKAFRCPIPRWTPLESHMVVRSGLADLGKWVSDERDLYEDYKTHIGGSARLSGERLAARCIPVPAPQRFVPLRRYADFAAGCRTAEALRARDRRSLKFSHSNT